MSTTTSWRFVLDAEPGGLRSGPQGGVALVAGEAAIRQSLLLLLATAPGERVMRPDYGCDLHRLVFSPADDTTAGLAIHHVRQAIERWEPRIDLIDVDARSAVEDPTRLDLIIDYRVVADGRQGRLVAGLALEAP